MISQRPAIVIRSSLVTGDVFPGMLISRVPIAISREVSFREVCSIAVTGLPSGSLTETLNSFLPMRLGEISIMTV
ncbi:hypothetical protein D3C87_1955930 [compost metagenome]